jgi:hypothetical protein
MRTPSAVLAVAAIAVLLAAAQSPAASTLPGCLIRVPEDVPTPRAAIDAAEPGDIILLAAGNYDGGLIVPEEKHDITIRGVDRSGVVLDGKGYTLNAIEIEADRVSLENLSAHDFLGNGFYWEKVDGFSGRYLTVWNVNLYGIYATESHGGLFEHDLVSGAADAAASSGRGISDPRGRRSPHRARSSRWEERGSIRAVSRAGPRR